MAEIFADTQWLLWLVGALVLGLLELVSLDFVFLMLALGALASASAAFLGAGFAVQALTFVATSLIALAVVRPAIKRWVVRSAPDVATNIDALVGRSAVTLAEVSGRGGQVKLAGETWTARSQDPAATYPAGVDVVVVRIDGATAVIGPATPVFPPPERTDT